MSTAQIGPTMISKTTPSWAAGVLLGVGWPPARAAAPVLWQIGKSDKSYDDLAIARNYPAFQERFGRQPLVFEIGRSEAARDWPFIHPGTDDAWAGSREHPFTIRFTLPEAPRGLFTLRIELTDAHSGRPPTLLVRVGGQAGGWGLEQSLATARSRIRAQLIEYEQRRHYPYDAVFLHGAVGDNSTFGARLAEIAQAWNERYEFPKNILSHNAEFFEYIERQYGAQRSAGRDRHDDRRVGRSAGQSRSRLPG